MTATFWGVLKPAIGSISRSRFRSDQSRIRRSGVRSTVISTANRMSVS